MSSKTEATSSLKTKSLARTVLDVKTRSRFMPTPTRGGDSMAVEPWSSDLPRPPRRPPRIRCGVRLEAGARVGYRSERDRIGNRGRQHTRPKPPLVASGHHRCPRGPGVSRRRPQPRYPGPPDERRGDRVASHAESKSDPRTIGRSLPGHHHGDPAPG